MRDARYVSALKKIVFSERQIGDFFIVPYYGMAQDADGLIYPVAGKGRTQVYCCETDRFETFTWEDTWREAALQKNRDQWQPELRVDCARVPQADEEDEFHEVVKPLMASLKRTIEGLSDNTKSIFPKLIRMSGDLVGGDADALVTLVRGYFTNVFDALLKPPDFPWCTRVTREQCTAYDATSVRKIDALCDIVNAKVRDMLVINQQIKERVDEVTSANAALDMCMSTDPRMTDPATQLAQGAVTAADAAVVTARQALSAFILYSVGLFNVATLASPHLYGFNVKDAHIDDTRWGTCRSWVDACSLFGTLVHDATRYFEGIHTVMQTGTYSVVQQLTTCVRETLDRLDIIVVHNPGTYIHAIGAGTSANRAIASASVFTRAASMALYGESGYPVPPHVAGDSGADTLAEHVGALLERELVDSMGVSANEMVMLNDGRSLDRNARHLCDTYLQPTNTAHDAPLPFYLQSAQAAIAEQVSSQRPLHARTAVRAHIQMGAAIPHSPATLEFLNVIRGWGDDSQRVCSDWKAQRVMRVGGMATLCQRDLQSLWNQGQNSIVNGQWQVVTVPCNVIRDGVVDTLRIGRYVHDETMTVPGLAATATVVDGAIVRRFCIGLLRKKMPVDCLAQYTVVPMGIRMVVTSFAVMDNMIPRAADSSQPAVAYVPDIATNTFLTTHSLISPGCDEFVARYTDASPCSGFASACYTLDFERVMGGYDLLCVRPFRQYTMGSGILVRCAC